MVKSARAKRMDKHHKRNKGAGTLNLVSLMDIFTILVFFLLVNSSDVETLPNAKDLQLPESIAEEKAKETVVILIGEEDIIVQGQPVAKIQDVMAIILMAAKYDVPVCPHGGGIALCNMIQHYGLWDQIAVSGHSDTQLVEYIDFLQEASVHPVKTKEGRYLTPRARGWGLEFKPGAAQGTVSADGKNFTLTEASLEGPDGTKLPRVPGHISYWFAWDGYLGVKSALYKPN